MREKCKAARKKRRREKGNEEGGDVEGGRERGNEGERREMQGKHGGREGEGGLQFKYVNALACAQPILFHFAPKYVTGIVPGVSGTHFARFYFTIVQCLGYCALKLLCL